MASVLVSPSPNVQKYVGFPVTVDVFVNVTEELERECVKPAWQLAACVITMESQKVAESPRVSYAFTHAMYVPLRA